MRGVKTLVLAALASLSVASSLAAQEHGAPAAEASVAEAVPGQTPARPSDGVAADAIGQIRSPYCPGLMLEVCPSPQAELLRDSIRMMAAEGRKSKEIVEAVIAAHGEQWRAVPKRSGAGAWAWLMPPAVLLLGLGLVATRLRSMRAARAGLVPDGGISDDERAALDAALRDYERSETAP